MASLVYFTMLFLWLAQDSASSVNAKVPVDVLMVALGGSVTLNCSYNCSTGFVRGCWSKTSENSGCHGTISKGKLCTVSLLLSNVSNEDLQRNYTCYTENKDDPQLRQRGELIVVLQLPGQTSSSTWTLSPKSRTENISLPVKPEDSSGGEFTGIKVLATVTAAVALVLTAFAIFLCLSRSRQSSNCKGGPVSSRSGSPLPPHAVVSQGQLSVQSERVTLRIPTPDNESDTEVPYADIMITVRGISTPELTQVGYLSPGDPKEWWGDESRSHLQASRSADRLHVPQPREVSRKMSTNSEYAVITYA